MNSHDDGGGTTLTSRAAGTVRRHPTAAFFVLTYTLSWTMWKAVDRLYLAGNLVVLPVLMLGIFGPGLVSIWLSFVLDRRPRQQGSWWPAAVAFVATWVAATLLITLDQVLNEGRSTSALTIAVCATAGLIPAFVVAAAHSRWAGVRDHLSSLVSAPVSPGYCLLALFLFGAIWSLGILGNLAFGMTIAPRTLPPAAAQISVGGAAALGFLYTMIPNGLSEEVGWRGFALPRLQTRHSPFVASLVLWVGWAAWHVPGYLGGFSPQSPSDIVAECLLMLPVTLVFTWAYNRAGGSLLVMALLHAGMNTTARFLPATLSGLALLVLFAASVVVLDRMWRAARVPPARCRGRDE